MITCTPITEDELKKKVKDKINYMKPLFRKKLRVFFLQMNIDIQNHINIDNAQF